MHHFTSFRCIQPLRDHAHISSCVQRVFSVWGGSDIKRRPASGSFRVFYSELEAGCSDKEGLNGTLWGKCARCSSSGATKGMMFCTKLLGVFLAYVTGRQEERPYVFARLQMERTCNVHQASRIILFYIESTCPCRA